MEKSTKKSNTENFLQEGRRNDVSKEHKKYLGTTVPEGYFVKSKTSILEKIKEEAAKEVPIEIKKQMVFWLRPQFRYMAAASLVFIFALTIWLQNAHTTKLDENNIEFVSFIDDNLLNSLLIDDAEFEAFVDATILNEIIIKASIAEQKSDDLFLNYLFLEDSLINNYSDDQFLEIIIL